MESASEVTSKIEHATSVFEAFASGDLGIGTLNAEADDLLALLGRLSGAERWQDMVRVARRLSAILSLLERWIELLRSLRTALRAAKEANDPLGEAWALHELGTLRLIAGRHAEADRDLGNARAIREGHADGRGLAATNGNLQVLCQTLRGIAPRRPVERLLHRLVRRPALAAIVAATLVVAGGAGGALLAHSPSPEPFSPATVAFSFVPGTPHAGQSIMFSATAHDPRDPAASYTWQWGDGDPAPSKVQRHEYRAPGRYEVVLTVRDTRGRVIGRSARAVLIARPTIPHGPNAYFTFKPHSPVRGTPVSFDASTSYDPRAPIASYEWSFGDGGNARGMSASHSFARAHTYEVSLTVTDGDGERNTLVQMVAVTAEPGKQQTAVTLRCPTGQSRVGEAVTVSGSVARARAGTTVQVVYRSPSGKDITLSLTSGAAGAYKTSFTPEEAGEWSVQSSEPESGDYRASSSEPCPFVAKPTGEFPKETTTSINCPSGSSSPGEAVSVSGSVTPARAGATVTLTYARTGGEPTTETLKSGPDGSYATSFTPSEEGSWSVESSQPESSEYLGSSSERCVFVVQTIQLH